MVVRSQLWVTVRQSYSFELCKFWKDFLKLCFSLCDLNLVSARLLACFPKQEANKLEVQCFFDLFQQGPNLKSETEMISLQSCY